MAVDLIHPEGLPVVALYRQVSVASGTRMVFTAGQVSVDANGNTVGPGDYAAQIEQCYRNVATALAAAGATFGDVAKLTAYIVDFTPEVMPALGEGIARATKALGVTVQAPFTGIGVQALAAPDLLVELEATAIL